MSNERAPVGQPAHRFPAAPATALSSPTGRDQQRALELAEAIVDDFRDEVRKRRRAWRAVGVGGLLYGLVCCLVLAPLWLDQASLLICFMIPLGCIVTGLVTLSTVWLPIHLLWGIALRMRLRSRCTEAGLWVGAMIDTLNDAARTPETPSRAVVVASARTRRLLAPV